MVGEMLAVVKYDVSGADPPPGAAGFTQAAMVVASRVRPNRLSVGGGAVERNDAYDTTQPTWSTALHVGTFW
jgi:hypothetical protein